MRKVWRYVVPILTAGAIGFVVGPVVAPAMGKTLRPAAKSGMKLGLRLFSSGRRRVFELRESLDDLLAEARHEMSATKQ